MKGEPGVWETELNSLQTLLAFKKSKYERTVPGRPLVRHRY